MKRNFQSDVWILLKKNISKGQFIGYSLANIVGLSIILVGILFYNDSQTSHSNKDIFFSNEYIVLSKKVDGIGLSPISFSPDEINDLEKQSWVKQIGRFTSSQFAVNGSVDLGGKRLSTYLFFESVPDDFFDVKPSKWNFTPEKKFVPVILSKDYLTLYNFGFATPQGLPQISEEFIADIPITLRLTGNDMQTKEFRASIVGFSSRLNTIAVPQKFMDWANKEFAPTETQQQTPSRLIVKIDRLGAAEMKQYLEEREIEISGDKAETGNISSFLSIVSTVVTTNGFVICILAMFILVLSIFLLLLKNKDVLRNLMLLGYHPNQVAKYYETILVIVNTIITIIALCITLFSRTLWNSGLEQIDLGGASILPTMIFAIVYFVGITCIDIYIIRRRMMNIWKGK
jgi:hypothetical protein